MNKKNKKIGMALGSGAVRGYALIPIIKRIKQEGIEIQAVSGSSIGALVGAYCALHGEIDSLWEKVKNMKRKDWLKLADPNKPNLSLIKGEKIKKFLTDHYYGDSTFKETQIPLVVCATDPIRRKSVYIDQGKIIDGVMASISIPGIFPPYKTKDRLYIDGGILDPVPVKPLLDMKIKKIVGINLMGYTKQNPDKEMDLITTLLNTSYIMMEQIAKREESKHLFILDPKFKPDPPNMLNFYKWKDKYEIGEELIEKKINALKDWLKE
ncbi:MAG: patatin-like phospholipase family protein [Acidobacteriota bacterium]